MTTDDSKQRIARLRHLQAWETQLGRLLGGWLPGIRFWEAKHAAGLHLWQNLQSAKELRTRLWELRVARPDSGGAGEAVLEAVRQLARAQHDHELLAGIHAANEVLAAAYESYLAETHPTWDAPSLDVVTRALATKRTQLAWWNSWQAEWLTDPTARHEAERWANYTREIIAAAGGVTGDREKAAELPPPPPGYGCLLPFGECRRDDRFTISLRGMERPPVDDIPAHTLWQFVNYAQEMQAAETLASVLWEVDDMDWDFYYDVARHCYDECRHSKMGEERVRELGHQLHDFPQFVGNYAWRQLYDPMRRYCMLTYIIEQDSFALKHETYKGYVSHGDATSAEAVLYDIIDETMHVRWGQRWVPELIKHQGESKDLDSVIAECRQAVLDNSLAPAQRSSAAKTTKAK
jgi:hypothetical protein